MKKTKKTVKKPFIGHVKSALIPHKGNQYRPHIIRRYGLVTVLLLVILLQAGYNTVTQGSVLGQINEVAPSELLRATNEERAKKGLPELSASVALTKAATAKAKDMFARQYWAHDAPDGTLPWKWIADAGYDYDYAGENLARNFSTNSGVMTAWMHSAEHKDNILSPHYSDIGIAAIDGELNGKPTTLVVALYASQNTGVVKGAAAKTVSASPPTAESIGPISRLGIAIQSFTPAVIGSIAILLVATIAAFTAHLYRNKLPKKLRRSWYRHHGAYKTIGLLSITMFMFVLYGSGQI